LNSYGYIGKNIRKPLLKIRDKISKYQKILYKTKLNKSGNKLKNKHRIKNKIRKLYQKTKNIVKELHNQTANYICKNYNKILIPKFETQKMTKQTKQSFKEYKLELINRGETTEERKENAKIFTKKCRLNKKVKYVLNTLSHFSFRQHLMEKSEEYGCELKVISEEYTSVTCTNCGHMSDNYKKRLKDCLYCNYKIDRDLNGARNILLKNLDVFKYEAKKPMVTYKPM
jgi:transposase